MDPTERKLRIWEIAVRGGATAFVMLCVAVLGYYANARLQEIEQRSFKAKAVIDVTNSQKELETNIATRLLENLMEEFFPKEVKQDNGEALEEQMFHLRLTALNFQDIAINLKPFYEHLDTKLTNDDQRERLRRYAKQVANRQAYRLVFEGGHDYGQMVVKKDEPQNIPSLKIDGDPVVLKVEDVLKDHIKVLIIVPYQGDIGPFDVSYFDMPLIDNVKLKASRLRLSLLLTYTEPSNGKAELRVIHFQPYMAPDRFDLQEETRRLRAPSLEQNGSKR